MPAKANKNNENICSTCYGFGMWPDGTAPMGPIDAGDGMPTIACPNCGANKNPKRTKSKVSNIHKMITKKCSNNKYTWSIVLFNPNAQFAFCRVYPGFQEEFFTETECKENMEKVLAFLKEGIEE